MARGYFHMQSTQFQSVARERGKKNKKHQQQEQQQQKNSHSQSTCS